MQRTESERSLAVSFVSLRRAIGIIGILLPLVLALVKIIFESPGLQGSISSYYYTEARNVFVGSMCAVAVFLISCKRSERWDTVSGILAGVFALGVAMFPTTPDSGATSTDKAIGAVHLASAAAFFIALALTSILLFTKTNPADTRQRKGWGRFSPLLVTSTLPGKPLSGRKKARNLVYRVCGYTIVGSIIAMFVVTRLPDSSPILDLHPTFWLESLAVVAFGASWLVKGETLLRDRRPAVSSPAAASPAAARGSQTGAKITA